MYTTSKKVIEQDKIEKLIEKAKQGDVEAQVLVGNYYFYPFNGAEAIDCKAAFDMYEKAAAQDYPEGIARLGYMYYLGYGENGKIILRSDKKKARELYEKAASMGNEFAKEHLEKMDRNGKYVNDINMRNANDIIDLVVLFIRACGAHRSLMEVLDMASIKDIFTAEEVAELRVLKYVRNCIANNHPCEKSITTETVNKWKRLFLKLLTRKNIIDSYDANGTDYFIAGEKRSYDANELRDLIRK